MFSRSAIRLAATGAAAAALVSACGTPASSAAPSDDGGGSLTVAFSNQPASLDPAFSTQISSDANLLNLCYDTLLSLDADGAVGPNLATHTVSPDGLTVTLTPVDGVVFHDGTPLDPAAVAANLERTRSEALAAPRRSALASIASVATTADDVVLTLSKPDAVLPVQLADAAGMMSSPAALQDPEYGSASAVGTGPFVCDDWRRDVSLTATRNPAYWKRGPGGEQLPLLERVTYRFITDDSTTEAELRAGGVDMAFTVPPAAEDAVRSTPGMAADEVGRKRSWWLALNNGGQFQDESLRRAVQLAVDPEQICAVVGSSDCRRSATFATGDDAVPGLAAPARNAAAARDLLAGAGFPDGVDVDLILRNRQIDQQIATLLQSQLAEAGFRVSIRPAEQSTVLEDARGGNYDLFLGVIDVPRIDPALTFDPYFLTGAANNWSQVSNPVIDQALTAARAGGDPAQRAAQYATVQREIVERAHAVFLVQVAAPVFHKDTVSGVEYRVDGQWNLGAARNGGA